MVGATNVEYTETGYVEDVARVCSRNLRHYTALLSGRGLGRVENICTGN